MRGGMGKREGGRNEGRDGEEGRGRKDGGPHVGPQVHTGVPVGTVRQIEGRARLVSAHVLLLMLSSHFQPTPGLSGSQHPPSLSSAPSLPSFLPPTIPPSIHPSPPSSIPPSSSIPPFRHFFLHLSIPLLIHLSTHALNKPTSLS